MFKFQNLDIINNFKYNVINNHHKYFYKPINIFKQKKLFYYDKQLSIYVFHYT